MIRLLTQSIRNKLLVITGLGTALVVLASLFGVWQSWEGMARFERLFDEDIAHEEKLAELGMSFQAQTLAWKNYLLRGDEFTDRQRYWQRYEEAARDVSARIDALRAALTNAETRERLQRFAAEHEKLNAQYQDAAEVFERSGYRARVADDEVDGSGSRLAGQLSEALHELALAADREAQEAVDAARSAMVESLVIMGVAILAAFFLFLWLVQRAVIRPARVLVEDLSRLADGDFSHPIEAQTEDELGLVAESAKQIQAKLGRALGQVADSVSQLAAAAEEMAVVSEQTTQGVSQQRGETNQVATAMNEMAATVQEVARHAADAADAANEADDKALEGQKVVDQTVKVISALAADVERAGDAIRRLDQDSAAIGGVLDVIRGVAEQTNLLALNAAIEAARAGEQGRGFAVVADEVRTLALRTQESTQEIHDMIERVQAGSTETVKVMDTGREKAKEAVAQAGHAGEALVGITAAVATIKDMNAQIASASEEQSAVTEEMNRNIVTISQISEQNAEGASQTTRASEELAKLAGNLQNLVGQFRLRGKAR